MSPHLMQNHWFKIKKNLIKDSGQMHADIFFNISTDMFSNIFYRRSDIKLFKVHDKKKSILNAKYVNPYHYDKIYNLIKKDKLYQGSKTKHIWQNLE